MDKKTLERANTIANEMEDLNSLVAFLQDIGRSKWYSTSPTITVDCYELSARTSVKIRSEKTRQLALLLGDIVSTRIAELERELKDL